MFVIVDKSNDSIHQEPTRPSWKSGYYKSVGAAKAGITRTVKFYQAAIDEVAEVVAEGKPEYTARRYNAFRDATDPVLGRTHKACLLYTSPSPRDRQKSRMPASA